MAINIAQLGSLCIRKRLELFVELLVIVGERQIDFVNKRIVKTNACGGNAAGVLLFYDKKRRVI